MSDLTDTVDRLFAAHCTDQVRLAAEAGTWPDALWQATIDAGLHLALVDSGEAALGLDCADAFAVIRQCGAHAVPIPLVETMLANWLLARSALAPRDTPTVIASRDGRATPWGGRASILQRFDDGFVVHEARSAKLSGHSPTLANEPRDHLDLPRDPVAITSYPRGIDSGALFAAEAALRTAEIAGAIDWITRETVAYAQTRVQFGKPIGKFQAVQHAIAQLAEHAATSAAAADMAADAFANDMDIDAIAAAKASASASAGLAAGIAHQMHGAIGFSREHALHHRTRRLWSWRDEAGNEAYWWRQLGDRLAGKPQAELWAALTRL